MCAAAFPRQKYKKDTKKMSVSKRNAADNCFSIVEYIYIYI